MEIQVTYKVLEPIALQATASPAREWSSAIAAIAISCVATALLGLSVPVLLAACLSATCLRLSMAAAVASGVVLGGLVALFRGRNFPFWVALATFGLGFCLMVILPEGRAGLFGLANALISLGDDAFSGYVGLIVGASDVASSGQFAILLGVCASSLAALASAARSSRVSLLVLALASAFAIVLGSGYTAPGLCLAACGWLLMMRLFQLDRAASGLAVLVADACTVSVLTLGLVLAAATLYSPNVVVAETDAALQSGIETLRYGSDSLPQGDLTQAYAMNDGKDSRLEVSVDDAVAIDLLLGGFVGGTYEDGTWTALDHTAYEGDWTGLFSWLETQGLDVNTQRATYEDFNAANGGDEYASVRVSVDVTGASRKYAYVPYSLQSLDGASLEGGVDLGSVAEGVFGADSYDYDAYVTPVGDGTQQPDWLERSAAASDTAIQAASVYGSFVEEQYLDVPDELQDDLDRLFFDETTWDAEAGSSVSAIVTRVRAMLSSKASYTDAPASYEQGDNVVTWLMEQEREGNSAHFATVAVLAFRQAGLPARYVEGYRAPAEDLEQGQATLTTEDAHAWAEVYVDGFGWVPVEVTPGFYEQVYTADQVIPVTESTSDGSNASDSQAGSVSGNVEQDQDHFHETKSFVVEAFLVMLRLLVVTLLLLCGIGLVLRRTRRTRRERDIASEDQDICVPALYAYLAACLSNSDIGFDAGKPLECVVRFGEAYPDIDPAELERVIRLHQDFTFGGRQLRPHELRVLRRFVERVHEGMPPAQSSRASVRRIFIDAL